MIDILLKARVLIQEYFEIAKKYDGRFNLSKKDEDASVEDIATMTRIEENIRAIHQDFDDTWIDETIFAYNDKMEHEEEAAAEAKKKKVNMINIIL